MKKIFYLFSAFIIFGCSSDDTGTPEPAPSEKQQPVAVDDKLNATQNEDLIINISGLLSNDTAVDNARISSIVATSAQGGSLVDNRDGTYTYTPPADFMGDDTFSYTLCVPLDAERCDTATVTISVGDAGDPVATNDTYETQEDKAFSINNYLSNDELRDNAAVSEINTEGASGTITLENDGSISYVPATGFDGQDSFTYTICDDDETPNCSTASITINVIDTGSPVAEDDSVVIAKGSGAISLNNLLNNDAVIDDAKITSIDDTSASGKLTLNEDGSVTYEASAGFTGIDTFTYSLCDDDATATCVTGTVTINIVETIAFNISAALDAYYATAIFTADPDLLYQTLSDFTTEKHVNRLEYTDRHDYLYDADASLTDPTKVVLMYSGEVRPDDEYQLGDLDDGESYNTEHIYPQSLLSTQEAKNDIHHMRVADVNINSERLNFPFTDGTGTYKLVEGNKWFPGDDWRGDVARMVMYVNLRYGEEFEDVGNLSLFLKWNREDPVSAFEMQRNEVISGAQGNRNPFIDNPYLATLIWGGTAAENTWD
ncbi:Ig-like domain-containing protein [Gramella sp. AN32]|uniref:Ig-like domain-containing protein n=1 Tax=Christiangramia antarctica TaxID=2058158 RepID=A0ABW5WZW2_9FLAO|nr:Ig-like domain-containing protein [Gramella sp. AN32]MCM4155135.1 endonuclease I [Gramella sp. AN32]